VVAVLSPHRGAVLALAFSPDNRTLLAAGGRDDLFGEVVLWDLATGGPTRLMLPGRAACVRGVSVSADGRLLASAGGVPKSGGQLDVWEVLPLAPHMPPAQ
jgi:WD40 repeat protein